MYDSPSDDDTNTVFRDVILLTLAGFITIVIMLLPHINPQGENEKEDIRNLGNLSVEIIWPETQDTDVDLWVKVPDDRPIGYSHKNGKYADLTRDDLGYISDPMPLNYENFFVRGIRKGEYIVNLHLYSDRSNALPVPVKVVVTQQRQIRKDKSSKVEQIFSSDVMLEKVGEERTVIRFNLDEDGNVEPDSLHDTPIRIR